MDSNSARDLDRRLAELVRSERHLVVQFVIELAGFAKRELHRELGYTSLFHYCVRQLGLSKSSAFRRSEVARLIGRFPVIAEGLAAGRLSIRTLVELREVLTEENHAAVLARAEGMSQEEAQLLAVEVRPKPVPRDVVRRLVPAETNKARQPQVSPAGFAAVPAETETPPEPPAPLAASAVVPAGTDAPPRLAAPLAASAAVPAGTDASPRPPEVVKPLTPSLRRLNVTVSAEFIAELEQVRAALSHQYPDGNFEQVVREAFKLVLARDRKRKGLSARPRPQSGPHPLEASAPESPAPESSAPESSAPESSAPDSSPAETAKRKSRDRFVPAAVRRAVWERDQGRCTWPMGDATICGSTHRLELDHDLEVARGGRATIGNIRLLCKSHNLLKAEQLFGRAFMAKFGKARPAGRDTC